MGNVVTLLAVSILLGLAMLMGVSMKSDPVPETAATAPAVPYIGSIEILNGCGIEGAANRVADYVRSKNFDVKSIGNAQSWNYPFTLVVSRTLDTLIAAKISHVLGTNKLVIIRNNENHYDVTVFIGPDFRERIQ